VTLYQLASRYCKNRPFFFGGCNLLHTIDYRCNREFVGATESYYMQHIESQPVDDVLLWNTETACRQLGNIHRATLWRLVKKGTLDAVQVAGRRMIVAASVRKLIAGQLAKAGN
jgi:hypothetical protein